MARSGVNLAERMQLCRPRGPEESIPNLGPEPHHAGKPRFQVAKFHRAHQLGDVSAERAQSCNIIRAWLERHDQEHGSAGERRGDSLRDIRQFPRGFKRTHGIEIGIVLHRALSSSKWLALKFALRNATLASLV